MATRGFAKNKTEEFRLFDEICAQGDCLWLRPQQRVPLPPVGKLIVVREGMIAIDAMPSKEKLQVLDFLVPGDVVSASTILTTSRISLRAIAGTTLIALEPPESYQSLSVHDYWTFLTGQCFKQLARVNIHQLMIGRLETEARVASFLLALALRNVGENAIDDTAQVTVALPMSRVDIANYLVINCDTLSRTMMRLGDQGLVERVSRHAVRVVDLNALKNASPIASLLSEVFVRTPDDRSSDHDLTAEPSTLFNLVSEKRCVVLPTPETHPARFVAGRRNASQGGW
jgi:CRP/FNR family transcriptional regulator, anaerobic regulatory protein